MVISDLAQKQLLVVEAKWGGIQTTNQIKWQIKSISAKHPDCKLTMLLLGGNNSQKIRDEVRFISDPTVSVSSIEWTEFQLAVKFAIDGNLAPSEMRALKHLHRGLKWYGIRFFEGN